MRELHGDSARFPGRAVSPMRYVRVVAQNRAQAAREGEAGFFVDLNLVDALELVFDRVFNG